MSERLAQELAARFGRRFCVLTGSGSTAIYLALKAIAHQRGIGNVIVPAIGCPSIAEVVVHAGFTPRFVDVNLRDFTLDANALAIDDNTRAILGVHLYGHAYDVEAVRKHGIPVIEDVAQSMGGRIGDALMGTFGEFAIFSFGGTKLVDAGGGGAILFDDPDALPVIQREVATLPAFQSSVERSLLATSHWQVYHGSMNALRLDPSVRVDRIWRNAFPLFRDLHLHQFPEDKADAILESLATLDARLPERIARAERYHAQLEGLPIVRSDAWRRSGALWRYSLLLPSRAATIRISDFLRRNGVAASNHYWSLADLFDGDKSLPNAAAVSERVVNFWVDDSATGAKIDRACALLREALGQPFSDL
ncbi:MAG TPA: DegT/DnrJ/EryC1/StrS family aminotransferase [Thermoanaerobaculia bacterium]